MRQTQWCTSTDSLQAGPRRRDEQSPTPSARRNLRAQAATGPRTGSPHRPNSAARTRRVHTPRRASLSRCAAGPAPAGTPRAPGTDPEMARRLRVRGCHRTRSTLSLLSLSLSLSRARARERALTLTLTLTITRSRSLTLSRALSVCARCNLFIIHLPLHRGSLRRVTCFLRRPSCPAGALETGRPSTERSCPKYCWAAACSPRGETCCAALLPRRSSNT